MHRTPSSDSKLEISDLRTNELHESISLANSNTKCVQKCRTRNDLNKVNLCRRRSSSQSTTSSSKPNLALNPHKVRSDHRVCFQMVSVRSESLHTTMRFSASGGSMDASSHDPNVCVSSHSSRKRARKQCCFDKTRSSIWKSMVDHLRKLRRKSVDQNKYCWSLSAATLMTASASAAIGSDRVFENECDFELSNSSHRDSITGYGIHNPTPLFPSIQVHSGTTTVSSIIAPPCALWVPMQSTHEPLDRFSTGFSRVFRPRRPRRYCGLCLKRFGCLRNRHSFACQLCDRPVCKRDFVAATQVCVCCSEQLHIMEEERLEAFTSTTSTPKGSTPIPFRSHRRAKSRDGFVPINHTKWGRSRGASDQYFKYSVMDRDTDLESHLSISELVREIDSELQEVGGSIPGDEPFIMTDFLRDTEWGDHVLDVAESVSVFDCNRWSLTSHISHLKAVDALLDVNPASDPIEVFYPLPLDEPDVSNVSPNASSCEEDTCPCFTPFQLSRFPAIRCEDLTQEDEGWSIVMDRGAMSRSLLQKFMLRESFSDAWRKCIHAE